ncbi:Uncharacterised protein [Mycobacteroides abscessus subsp. abscessus]|nr:Uncharacterised protein [Mycobacteroides abscessus subsp. abscessus]SLE85657.1 Uncharacterised protein [Mycobacteroides abscessus subsp. massiliense]
MPYRIRSATFSGLTAWPTNRPIHRATFSFSRSTPAMSTVRTSGVLTAPGTTTVTPILYRARSKRSTSETPRRPYLLALYAACHGRATIPAAEETFTIWPPLRALIIAGTKLSMTWMGPIRLMSTTERHCS